MKLELDLNQLLGMEYDDEGEPVGHRELRDEVVKVAAAALVKEVREEAKRSVREDVESVVRGEVRAIVRKALAEPIQQTSSWGEKKGDPVTVLELIRTQLEAFLNNKPRGRDSYNRDPNNLADVIEDATRSVLSKELQAEVDQVRKAINTQIQEHALKAAAASLTKGLKV